MLLDAVLDDGEFAGSAPMDKRRHFVRHLCDWLELRDYPHLMFGEGPEKAVLAIFRDKLPIGTPAARGQSRFTYR